MKVSVKMLFPMILFIFPVIFIILLGPAIVNVLQVLKADDAFIFFSSACKGSVDILISNGGK